MAVPARLARAMSAMEVMNTAINTSTRVKPFSFFDDITMLLPFLAVARGFSPAYTLFIKTQPGYPREAWVGEAISSPSPLRLRSGQALPSPPPKAEGEKQKIKPF